MFLKINEPKSSEPKVLGIDLGTTHSLVAVAEKSNVNVLKEHGKVLMPSVVHFGAHETIVGEKAYEKLGLDKKNTIASTKRFMGKALQDVDLSHTPYDLIDLDNQVAYKTQVGIKTPIEVSAEILKSLYQRALNHVTGTIKGAVITVPAYFDEAQRLATKHAAQLAGIDVLRLINEPTAAAIAYGLQDKASGLCLVFDLGGGTFDVTLLKIDNGVFHVLATGGDTALGGDDMDRYIAESVQQQGREALLWAKHTKEALTVTDAVELSLNGETLGYTRDALNQAIKPLIQRCILIVDDVLAQAKCEISDVADIILVGGATKVPYVQQQLKQHFGRELLATLDPEQVVVQGAASHGASLLGTQTRKSLLIDVIPLSLGLETMGGVVEKILMRNTPIPAQAKQVFTTYDNHQTGMILHVVQGERELAKDNRSLGRFILNKLPQLPKGHAKVEVTFQINEEGLLTVSAKELNTNEFAKIQIKPSYGLSDDTITQMLEQALTHADIDMKLRQLQVKKLEAGQLIKAIDIALAQDEQLLDDTQRKTIEAALGHLKEKIEENSEDEIIAAIHALESVSDDFMRQRLDKTLKGMVKGKSLTALNDVICRK